MNTNQKLLIQFALRHLKSNLDEATNEIVNSFWAFENEGDQLDDSQIEDHIDQCISQFGDDNLFLVFGEEISEKSKVSQRTMTKLEMLAYMEGIDEATPWLEVATFPTKEEAEDYIKEEIGDEPKTLDNLRIDAADNCFAMADFGSMVVEETDGWQWDNFSNEWNRNVYVSSGGDEPTTRVRFKVVFEPNSAKVVDSEIIN